GSGNVTADKGILGSAIDGTVKVTFKSAVLKNNNFEVKGGTLTINGDITGADGKTYTITVSGESEVKVAGDEKATVVVNDSANVTVDGTIAGDVTNNGTGSVNAGGFGGSQNGNNIYTITPDAVAYIVNK